MENRTETTNNRPQVERYMDIFLDHENQFIFINGINLPAKKIMFRLKIQAGYNGV